MIKHLGYTAQIVEDAADLRKCHRLILPGVGSWDTGAAALSAYPFLDDLNELVLIKKKPILGICLGMQLMLSKSDEGLAKGLNWLPGTVRQFDRKIIGDTSLKIPHMGWNKAKISKNFKLNLPKNVPQRFYFVHSYHATDVEPDHVLGTTEYGYEFVSAISNFENIFGVQFHPEKSHKFGMSIFEAFKRV